MALDVVGLFANAQPVPPDAPARTINDVRTCAQCLMSSSPACWARMRETKAHPIVPPHRASPHPIRSAKNRKGSAVWQVRTRGPAAKCRSGIVRGRPLRTAQRGRQVLKGTETSREALDPRETKVAMVGPVVTGSLAVPQACRLVRQGRAVAGEDVEAQQNHSDAAGHAR